ncbi:MULTISPECIES: citrulline utilization hydrolase CtlX [unclassified Kaistella]|uniref:citrulline utilization hydrolase CtlX n=1 Tax=unclassified Kaistella TaxID=2762626 RepID=UPI00273684C0|nr:MULTISPECIES: arginine deiminase-related protein [unclassified Kaistella]MDP2452664.1 arginine deiminase-related protein [Kaistella sp. SH11-4b]MDP2455573.1 arginine deiminase-related protein [Kaistella sp. SH40-3]MDP2458477.1 arginine deiminase-related protein [Kaistella sp. SH19-2b]
MQTASTVLMVEPIAFGYNSQTAENNYFQVEQKEADIQEKALQEFNNFVGKLRDKGIKVITVKDTLEPHSPDSIFPNNWVSFHEDGRVALYPMFAPNRRVERRADILDTVRNESFKISEINDLSSPENEDKFLEGTGSMIFDHDHKIAYGSVSLRLDEELFRDFCDEFGYTPVVFHSFQNVGNQRLPIYHTNVMMCVAEQFVVICLDCIDDELEREKVQEVIKSTEKEVIEISEDQMHQFAGNMLQVQNEEGTQFLVMSETAYKSLTKEQIEKIESYCEIIYADLNTIEVNGGGSARCMLAEVFLPKN